MRKPDGPVVEFGGKTDPFALSPEQEEVWFGEQAAPAAGAYHTTGVLSLPVDVPAVAVGVALEQLTARHEALRMVFEVHDGRPEQRVRPTPSVDFAVLPTAADRDQALDQLSSSSLEIFRLST